MSKYNVIIPLDKNLGNQMFQWAFARSLQEAFDIDVYFDKKHLLKLQEFYLYEKLKTNNIFKYIFKNQKYYQKYNEINSYKYDKEALNIVNNTIINGSFQTEKYFSKIKNLLIKDFSLKIKLDKKQIEILKEIISCESVSIEIFKENNENGNCKIEYYQEAINRINKLCNKDLTLFIFSDDLKMCKKLKLNNKYIIVNSKNKLKNFELIKNCKHNIINNSSLSWWGAWLNENPNKVVVAPKPWNISLNNMQEEYDLIPENWERIYANYDYPYFVV